MFSLMRNNVKNKLISLHFPDRKCFNLIQNNYSICNNHTKRHFMQKFSSFFKIKKDSNTESTEKSENSEKVDNIFSEEELAKEKEEDAKLREEISKESVLKQMEVK